MTARLVDWWRIRTPRERWLLALLAGLALLMAGWFGVVRPLDLLLADARRAHAEALDAEAAARSRATRLAALRAAARRPLPAPLALLVERSAVDAGFTGAAVSPRGPGRVSVTIPTARPPALFAWLEGLRVQGIVVHSAAIRPAAGQTVSVELLLGSGRRG